MQCPQMMSPDGSLSRKHVMITLAAFKRIQPFPVESQTELTEPDLPSEVADQFWIAQVVPSHAVLPAPTLAWAHHKSIGVKRDKSRSHPCARHLIPQFI